MGYARAVSRPEGDATLSAMGRSGWPVLTPAPELAAGAKIGRYAIVQLLGSGGMGVVYSARDTELARDVALKIVRPRADVGLMQARLRREAKAMARLSHSNVVPVFDIGTHEGQLFIAMELVSGTTLRSWVAEPRPWRSVVRLFVKAGRGLEAAHAAGLVHRDFKPDNVMVGRGDEPRITDFGLARDLDEDSAAGAAVEDDGSGDGGLSQITATGGLAGTPVYMAPEQLLGQSSSPATDQFSFCVSLFEVLYGVRPFRNVGPRAVDMVAEIRAGRIVKPDATRGVPGWVHAALVRGLAFESAQRWPSMRALVDALARGRRHRRPGFRALAVALVIVVAAGLRSQERAAAPSCQDAARKGNDALAILVCQDEYARTSDPATGARLADALRRLGRFEEATTLATELLATSARADALYTLGKVAYNAGRRDDAERSLRLASELHRAQQEWGESAADLQALAAASNDIIDQLAVLDQGVLDARRGRDGRTEGYCHVTLALRLSEIGARRGALDELERARPLMTAPGDRVTLDLQIGNVLQNLDDNALAVGAFERALAGAEAATIARQALSARLNLVYSLAETGRFADAARHLEATRALDPDDRGLAVRLALEGRLAARAGDPARAATLVDRAIAATDPDAADDLVERDVERGELALARGELAAAEQAARAAIARIEGLRSTHPPVELRSWLVTDRRIPYELLFASLARRGDAAGALVAFDRQRGLGALAGLVRGDDARSPGAPLPIADLARLFPALATSALALPPDDRAILDAARGASLLALVVARGELWRITADGGVLGVARIGELAALRPRLDRLQAAPGDRAAAAALGELLVPAELARTTDRVLHVVLDEPLAELPVAALVVGGRGLIAARPIVRPARVADLGCAARPAAPRGVVAGATRAALLDAGRGDLLEVAVPAARDALGEALVLADGRVRALEIAGHGSTAAQVVVVADGGVGLATAFLAAGADQVIAPIRPVPGAHIIDRLRGADATDLARGLARLQTAADGDDWLGFAAFGRAICNPKP